MLKFVGVLGIVLLRAEQSGVGGGMALALPTAQSRSRCQARLKSLMLRTEGAMGTLQTH